MKIKTPDGNIYELCNCEIIDDNDNQEDLAKELFINTGILIADLKGGEKDRYETKSN